MSEKADVKAEEEVVELTPEQQIQDLANRLRFEKAKTEVLLGEVIALEDDLTNRCMAEFDAVVSDETREYWREQMLTNRAMATALLTELARAKQGLMVGGGESTRRPLHNRALSRPVAPVAVGGGGASGPSTGSGQATGEDDRAAKIRNRAHEISRAERLPFSAAFRRAERELGGQ